MNKKEDGKWMDERRERRMEDDKLVLR